MSNPAAPLTLAVPVFNCERFLAATLESLDANGANLRWWLQDGASTDRTVEIARKFAREGDTIVSEPDSGQVDALNRAMPRMGGEIIGFINGDDLLASDAAERVLHFFCTHRDVDLVYGDVEWLDEWGNTTGSHGGSRLNSLEDILDIYDVWWNRRQWVQPEVFFRRSLLEKVGGFDPTYHLAFDFDFWVRCFLAGARVAHLPGTLAKFRLHGAQKSTAADRAADEIRAIVGRHLNEDPPMNRVRRRVIEARLSYDLFQSGTAAHPQNSGFGAEFLRHPHWIFAPAARARAWAACTRLLTGGRYGA